MRTKRIDPIDVKQAIKDGQLKVTIKRRNILLSDTLPNGEEGDTVKIGEINECDICHYDPERNIYVCAACKAMGGARHDGR